MTKTKELPEYLAYELENRVKGAPKGPWPVGGKASFIADAEPDGFRRGALWMFNQLMRKHFCPCGGVILADTEDWPIPMCFNCFEHTKSECLEIFHGQKG